MLIRTGELRMRIIIAYRISVLHDAFPDSVLNIREGHRISSKIVAVKRMPIEDDRRVMSAL